jgi:hypothetical protein
MKRILGIVCLGAGLLAAAELKLGKPLTVKEPVSIEKVYAEPEKFLGKTVAVKGKITEVCQMMGCWMNLVDSASGKSIRIKVNDGEIEFPKNGAGKIAIAEAKHEADEMGRKFDPKSVLGPVTRYQIKGSGAVVLD